jgi:cytosine/adenosine deaminase-related metal-dependent hydrolase
VIVRGGVVATLDPPRVERADLRVEGGRIVERAPAIEVPPGEDVLEAGGGLVLPGLVNAHTHLYSALARGMPAPAPPPRTFVEVLERVWWRLDRALDEESIYLSGLCGAIDAARSGTTVLFDHHSSPSAIAGSLGMLASAGVGGRVDVYEPVHGSAPDIAGTGLANPLGAIASAALLLRYTARLEREAQDVEASIRAVLERGYRTADIQGRDGRCIVGTEEMGTLVAEAVAELADMRHAYHAV